LFLTRLYRSWSAGIITGISFIWFLLAAFFFLPHAHGARHLALFIAIGAVPIVGSQVISRRRLQAEIVLPLDIPKMEASPDAPSDQREVTFDLPINDWTKDRLNRGPLIQSTAQLILRDKAPVIAIVGGFGEGKTSALNLLATSLKARRDMLVVQFSSWLPGGTERLADSLFATVSQHINSRYVVPGLGRELRRFAKLLAGTVPKLGENLKQFLEEPSQTEQLRSLKELLARLPLRVVVLVDELDRMDKAELLLLLKAIRGVVDLPNVTYVCAFDRSSVVRLISEDRQYGESYLEKFFPVQRRLPRVDQEVLGAVFDKELERICLALGLLRNEDERKKFNEKLLPLWHNPVKHVLRNFRKMAIFFNSLHGALAPISAEVNVFDMVVLQLVKFVSEDAYEFIYDNGPLFYNPAWRVDLWPERVAVEDDRAAAVYKERFDSFFASMAAPSRDQLRELLQAIFPTVKGYSRGERISFRGTNDELADKGRLIYHPDYFPRYFIQQVQTSMFGIAEMSRFIDEMNREDGVDPSLHKFRQVTDGLGKNTWKRWSFLDQLVTECDRLGDLQAEAVVLGVAGISDSLEEEVLGLGEWGRARALVFAATKRFAGTPKLEGVLETAISKSTSDGFSADILRFSTMMKDRNNIITDWTGVTEGALRAAFAERMRSRYAIGSQREFPYGRLGDISAFHLWVKTSDGDKELEVAFLRDRFARFPIEQGRFLAGVLPNTVVFEGDPLDTVGNLFPLDELHELVKAVRLETFAESDRDSVRRFLNLMARRSGGEAETDSPGSHP
jgi:KAP family P-loop domain